MQLYQRVLHLHRCLHRYKAAVICVTTHVKSLTTTRITRSLLAESYYTSGCWSPSRPGVIFLGDESGKVEVWDLLDSSHEPSLRVRRACLCWSMSRVALLFALVVHLLMLALVLLGTC